MGILGKRAGFEALRSIDSSTFTGSYQALGTVTSNPCVLLKILNNSTKDVTVSFDGVNDNDYIPAGSFVLYDFGSDAQSTSKDNRLALESGTQIWVKGAVGTGSVFLVAIYQGG